jgi:hypothetical protein
MQFDEECIRRKVRRTLDGFYFDLRRAINLYVVFCRIYFAFNVRRVIYFIVTVVSLLDAKLSCRFNVSLSYSYLATYL